MCLGIIKYVLIIAIGGDIYSCRYIYGVKFNLYTLRGYNRDRRFKNISLKLH